MLSLAHAEEANTHVVRIVDGLSYTSQAKRHAIDAKLDFHPPEYADSEALLGTNAAATDADIHDAPG